VVSLVERDFVWTAREGGREGETAAR